MHMNQPERGDVFMLPSGDLVVYDALAHQCRCIPLQTVREGDIAITQWPNGRDCVTLSEGDMKACQLQGSLEHVFAGLVALCAPTLIPVDAPSFLVCKGERIYWGVPFRSLLAAERWIETQIGGHDHDYWIACVSGYGTEKRPPWRAPRS